MSTNINKLRDPDLPEDEQDAIIGSFVRRHENERLRKRWEDILSTEHGVSKRAPADKRKAVIRRIGFVIAAIAASLLIFLTVIPNLGQQGGEELLAAYVTELNVDNTRAGGNTDEQVLRRRVADAYAAEDFPAAVAAAETLHQAPAATPEDELTLGKAYLRNGNYEQAGQTLRRLIGRATDYSTEARYALGLSLLQAGKKAEAIAELQRIAEADGASVYEKAQRLIEEFQ